MAIWVKKEDVLAKLDFFAYYSQEVPGLKATANGRATAKCPFHKDSKPSFSIDLKTGLFNCFGCNEGGDVFIFEMKKNGGDFVTILKKLASFAGLITVAEPVKEIVATYNYVDHEGNLIFQVVRWNPKGFSQRRKSGGKWVWNLDGVFPTIYNLPAVLHEDNQQIIIVEGEKDADFLNDMGFVATTNPMGAGKWKDTYSECFQDKVVIIIPDNDEPGKLHAENVMISLVPIARSVRILNLPGLPEHGDVSDWLVVNTKESLEALISDACKVVVAGKVTLKDVEAAFSKWLVLSEDDLVVLRMAFAAVVANRTRETDPLWTFIVGPPASCKTEILRALEDLPDVVKLSNLTPQTFVSGMRGATSLLPKIDGKLIVMKDFTTVLSQYEGDKNKIMAQLREIYDGTFTQYWGTGKSVNWKGRVGFLVGVTPFVEAQQAAGQHLGERYVMIRTGAINRQEIAVRSATNSLRRKEMRKELLSAVNGFFAGLTGEPKRLTVPDEFIEEFSRMANFCSLARSRILRNSYTGSYLYDPAAELPPRLSSQFCLLAGSLAVIADKDAVGEDEVEIVRRVTACTIPSIRFKILRILTEIADYMSTTKICDYSRFPNVTVKESLEDMRVFGLVERGGSRKGYLWRLKEEWLPMMQSLLPFERLVLDSPAFQPNVFGENLKTFEKNLEAQRERVPGEDDETYVPPPGDEDNPGAR